MDANNKKARGKIGRAVGHVKPGVEPGMKLGFTSSPRVADEVCLSYGTLFSCVKTAIQAMANVSRFLWNRRMKHLRHWVQSFG